MKAVFLLLGSALLVSGSPVRPPDDAPPWHDLFNGKDLTGWVNMNVAKDTFTARDGMIVCNGKPTGVMRTEKMYENFLSKYQNEEKYPTDLRREMSTKERLEERRDR